jgi:hypothetical protein
VREFAPFGPVSACAFGELQQEHFDLIINATSASLRGEVPAIPSGVVDALTTCYDMSYGTTETPFTNWGRVHGAERSVQGWGMLVEQAAEAFGLWRGVGRTRRRCSRRCAADARRTTPAASRVIACRSTWWRATTGALDFSASKLARGAPGSEIQAARAEPLAGRDDTAGADHHLVLDHDAV